MLKIITEDNLSEELYIAIFSIGSYQEIISGVGGIHHFMLPEGNELIIYKDKEGKLNYYKVNNKQITKEILEILDYNVDYLSRFND